MLTSVFIRFWLLMYMDTKYPMLYNSSQTVLYIMRRAMERRLYRSRTDRMIWGVCGGLAKYLNLDPTLVRILFVLLIFASGVGILAYIIMAIVVPLEESRATQPGDVMRENVEEIKETASELGRELRSTLGKEGDASPEVDTHRRRRNGLGIVLIIIGIIILLGNLNLFWWWRWANFWPVIIIVVGLLIIIGSRRR